MEIGIKIQMERTNIIRIADDIAVGPERVQDLKSVVEKIEKLCTHVHAHITCPHVTTNTRG